MKTNEQLDQHLLERGDEWRRSSLTPQQKLRIKRWAAHMDANRGRQTRGRLAEHPIDAVYRSLPTCWCAIGSLCAVSPELVVLEDGASFMSADGNPDGLYTLKMAMRIQSLITGERSQNWLLPHIAEAMGVSVRVDIAFDNSLLLSLGHIVLIDPARSITLRSVGELNDDHAVPFDQLAIMARYAASESGAWFVVPNGGGDHDG